MTAKDLVNDPFSSYEFMSSVRRICLPPRYLGNVAQGIRDQLDSEVNFYCPDLQSVVISYENLKLLQAVGAILDDSPFLHFKIQADYVVFKPTIGCILKGIVNKVSKDHVGCLVHDRFNASIHRPRQHMNGWRGSQLQQGEEFPFEVLDIYSNNAVISIKGKLIDQKAIAAYLKSLKSGSSKEKGTSENEKGDYVDYDEGEITLDSDPILMRKRKRTGPSQQDEAEDPSVDDWSKFETPRKRKKKSSHKNEVFASTSTDDVDNSSTPKAGKKRKHSLKEDEDSNFKQTPDVSSAKKVRFHDSLVSPESKKKSKMMSAQISPIGTDKDSVNVHDGSYLDSSVFDESYSQVTKSKKKKKHKKSDSDNSFEETELTRLKSPDVSTEDTNLKKKKKKKQKKGDSESEQEKEGELSSSQDTLPRKMKKKKKRAESESASESSDAQSLALSGLTEGFGKIFSDLQARQKSKKNKNKEKDLINVMMTLQSEVMKTTSKLVAAKSSSKKKKQKKKKNRASSSPDRNSDGESSKGRAQDTTQNVNSDSNDSTGEVFSSNQDSTANIDMSYSFSRKRASVENSSDVDTTSKKKKKVKKQR